MKEFLDISDYVLQFFDLDKQNQGNKLKNIVGSNKIQSDIYFYGFKQKNSELVSINGIKTISQKIKPIDFVINQYLKFTTNFKDISYKILNIQIGENNLFELTYSTFTNKFYLTRNLLNQFFKSKTIKNIQNIPFFVTLKVKLPLAKDDIFQKFELFINNDFIGSQISYMNYETLKNLDGITINLLNGLEKNENYLYEYQIFKYNVPKEQIFNLNNSIKYEGMNFINYIKSIIPTELDIFYFYSKLLTRKVNFLLYYNTLKQKLYGQIQKYNISREKLLQFLTNYSFKEYRKITYNIEYKLSNLQIIRDILYKIIKSKEIFYPLQYTLTWKLGLIILAPYQLYDILESKLYNPTSRIQNIKTYQYYPDWWKYKYNIYISQDGKEWFLIQRDKIGQLISVELPPFGNWSLAFEKIELPYDQIPQSNLELKNYSEEQLDRLLGFID